MSMNPEAHLDEPSSARIGRAVNELLGSTGFARAAELIDAASWEIDQSFTAPSAPEWVEQSPPPASEHPLVTADEDARRSGIIRYYTGAFITGARASTTELTGLRFTHKDNIGISGYPLAIGNPALDDRRSALTSPLLTSIEAAGGTIVGANHMAEFALSPTGHNHWLGDGINPRNDAYLSGGSSSGSAISVASGSSDVSLGTDTGGSVRLPAAFCGLSGYKPTNGLFSSVGLIPLSETLDTIGMIASAPATIRAVAEVMYSDASVVSLEHRDLLDLLPESSRTEFSHLSVSAVERICDADVAESYASALSALGVSEHGRQEPDTSGPAPVVDFDDSDLNRRSVVVVSVEAARNVGRILGWEWDLLGDQVLSRVIRGTTVSAIEYADALAERETLQRRFLAEAMPNARFLLTPTSPIRAPRAVTRDGAANDEVRRDYMRASRFTRVINYLGLPAITVPLPAAEDSMTAGLQIIGRPFDDRALLDFAVIVAEALT
ncbi:amidase [Brevibacterium sp. GP-SGM9]|uniref:amidase n=1 Tax=Brevibacterium sp. GP-SGM9 TaxID=3376990 RepID=UPI0039A67C7F